jgi:uncharacterized protein (TIGR02118 family)
MIKVSVLYPSREGAKFDMDYYMSRHMPMVTERLGAACKKAEVDVGIGGGAPGSPAPYVAIAHLLFDSVDTFQAAFGPHAEEILGDIPNYTDIEAVVQVGEVRM